MMSANLVIIMQCIWSELINVMGGGLYGSNNPILDGLTNKISCDIVSLSIQLN